MTRRYLWDLLWALVVKEIKSRYKSATLGFLWIFVNPLLQMVALTIVFSYFLRFNIPNYSLFVFSGLLPWTFFNTALTAGTSSLIGNRDLIRKVPFPKELLPISAVLAHLVTFLVSLTLLVIVSFVVLGVRPEILLLIPVVLTQALLLIGMTLLASSLDIYYRDVSFILQAGIILWFYLTPIFYPLSFVPAKFQLIYSLNPMVGIIASFQAIFYGARLEITPLIISAIEATLLTIIGYKIFQARSRYFADWV